MRRHSRCRGGAQGLDKARQRFAAAAAAAATAWVQNEYKAVASEQAVEGLDCGVLKKRSGGEGRRHE